MEFSCKLFFILVLLLPIIGRCSAHFSHHKCNKEYDTTSNYKRKQLIGQVTSELLGNLDGGFAVQIRSMDSETIYGLALCRGDINFQTCSGCILEATHKVQKLCPSSAQGQFWLDKCFIRYDSDNFIGQADTSYARFWPSPKPAMNSIEFERTVDKAMREAKLKALKTINLFGAIEVKVDNSDVIVYAIAQCTRDLPKSTCRDCIDSLSASRSMRCKGRSGCRGNARSCMVQYESYNFLLSPII